MFLKSVNPDKARARARVFTPDVPRARRYTPKALKLAASGMDMVVTAGGTGTVDIALEDINALFLVEDLGWSPYIIVRNYAESASVTLDDVVSLSDPTPVTRTVTNKSLTSNVATLTTSVAHGLYHGATVVISGVDATFNGTYTVDNVPSSTTFTYSKTAANVASTASSGTVTAATDDRAEIVVDYDDVLKTLGKVDPGTYDLYAQRTVGSTVETTYIASGNISISLASSLVSAYTLG